MNIRRLQRSFFRRDVLVVAPELLGKRLVMISPDGKQSGFTISETEAYRGREDLACHASKGKTPRNMMMFGDGGFVYMYLIYGMYWMFNIVTSVEGMPQAVLVRGLKEVQGPGRLTRQTGLNGDYYGEDLVRSTRLWVEDPGGSVDYTTGPRIGIEYAGAPWKDMPWRYCLQA
jgi:DNA-3-methyladenine glycosylase